jgi:hypothetical protein
MRRAIAMMMAAGLGLGACNSGGGDADGSVSNMAAYNQTAVARAEKPVAKFGACPFGTTSDWHGTVEHGRLLVDGKVDVLMAGMKPQLTRRASSPGTSAFDLALVSDPTASVTDTVRYEATGAPRTARGEIYCGGKKIAGFNMVLVVD